MIVEHGCNTCTFWRLSAGHCGVCVRYPTAVDKHDIEWCGEFKPKPETERIIPECQLCQWWTPENTTQLGVCRESPQPHAKVPTDGCQRFKPIPETEHITEETSDGT